MTALFAAIWDAVPLILSGAFVLVMLFGFFGGLRIKPRPANERVRVDHVHLNNSIGN